MDSSNNTLQNGGGDATPCIQVCNEMKIEASTGISRIMSVCFESSSAATNTMNASPETSLDEKTTTSAINQPGVLSSKTVQPFVSSKVQNGNDQSEQIISSTKSMPKIIVANATSSIGPVFQKISNPPVITVLNPSGPLTVVKTLCVTSGAPQYTLVNSAPLNVTSTIGKSPTITLLNAPVTVVKAITTAQNVGVEKNLDDVKNAASASKSSSISTITENRAHNVFVKNTCPETTIMEITQNHRLLPANSYTQSKTLNGQRNKIKIVSNIVVPGTSQTTNNILINKSNQRYIPRQKVICSNGATTKYLNKTTPNTYLKPGINPTRLVYPTHKNQIKALSPVSNYLQKFQHGVKTIASERNNPSQMARTSPGLRTISPQNTQKIPIKPTYISKHIVQPQRMKQVHGKGKGVKVSSNIPYNTHMPISIPDKQSNDVTFDKILTAQIMETLSNGNSPVQNNRSDILPPKYEAFNCPEILNPPIKQCRPTEEESNKSGLDALSLVCQAVLLDHNYYAHESRLSPPVSPLNLSTHPQVIGLSSPALYSPGSLKGQLPSTNTTFPSTHNRPLPPRDVSNTSDISDGCKPDTEGEDTDTAPEAEAVANESYGDGYGDYITRCICGFLHDDGYMVECDRCKIWQHVQCVLKNRQVPEEYLCDECDPTKQLDNQKARSIQQQWLRDRQLQDALIRREPAPLDIFKAKDISSDSDSSEEDVVNKCMPKSSMLVNNKKTEHNTKQSLGKQKRENAKEGVRKKQKRKERKIIRKRTKAIVKNQSDYKRQDTWATHLPQLRQWIEKYEEASTNHYSPELRARISSIRVNGVCSDSNIHYDSTVQKCRVYTQPLTEMKYLIATVSLPPNTVVVELRGKYMLSMQHRNSGVSLPTRQHSQRPGPFLFFYRLQKDNTEVCIDTRTYGNSARFIRRSCKPNAELKHYFEKGVLHIYVVTIAVVDKNYELTIKHESHDLASIGTTTIACACGNREECTVNKSSVKKNRESSETPVRKRRRRRLVACNAPERDEPKFEEPRSQTSPSLSPPSPVQLNLRTQKPKPELKKDTVSKSTADQPNKEPMDEEKVEETNEKLECAKSEVEEESLSEEVLSTPTSTRRNSHRSDDKKALPNEERKEKSKKLSREERKLQAILKAIEQMEKAETKKQENQAHRESERSPRNKDEEKQEPKPTRHKRKSRARTVSQSSTASRKSRLYSTDSYLTATSGEENLLSPRSLHTLTKYSAKNTIPHYPDVLSNTRNMDSVSNSSPDKDSTSAGLLAQTNAETLEQGVKFPKTKKGMMNEWLSKVPEVVQASNTFSTLVYSPGISKNENNAQETSSDIQLQGSAKKRWLRQAIHEDSSCDTPPHRAKTPPITETVAPPKKRRLHRESISMDNSPPTTVSGSDPLDNLDNMVSIKTVYPEPNKDSNTQILDPETALKKTTKQIMENFAQPQLSNSVKYSTSDLDSPVFMDPRLSCERYFQRKTSVGEVGESLSRMELGKSEGAPKRKVKLSITEYLQRKKQNLEEKFEGQEQEPIGVEENISSELINAAERIRSECVSTTSSTSITSSDDDPDIMAKAPVFNSEPTELERQRETSSLRFKKGFELTFDKEPPATIKALLKLDLETTKIKPGTIQSPVFDIPDNPKCTLSAQNESPLPAEPPVAVEIPLDNIKTKEITVSDTEPLLEEEKKIDKEKDEEEDEGDGAANSTEKEDEIKFENETISYVPPYNNPVYPNFSSTDDEARYEGRNPSPPADLDEFAQM